MRAGGLGSSTRRRPIALQDWRDVVFVHWPVDPALLRARVPPDLALDLWEGNAWVSLLPFRAEGSRPALLPAALGVDYLEMNLRTYVHARGERGIWFFSLDADSSLAVSGARLLVGLPYVRATMEHRAEGGTLRYRCTRASGAYADIEVRPEGPTHVALEGSLEHFLFERYALFVHRPGRLTRVRVEHAPWAWAPAAVERLDEDVVAAQGIPAEARGARLVHVSPGVRARLFAPERVGEALGELQARTTR